MRREDAPRPGWYPDPQGRDNLRYWDGLDWTEARRAPPSQAELLSYESQMAAVQPFQYQPPAAGGSPGHVTAETQQVVDEVRRATRTEIDRAAQVFSERA